MNKTGIEYIDFTSNPIVGCDMSLPCAERCWARRMARRQKAIGTTQYQTVVNDAGEWTGKTAFNEATLQALLRRRKPATIGLCFMGDAFHPSVPDAWLDRMFAVVALTPHLKYLIPTKRAKRMREYFSNEQRLRMKVALGPLPLPNLGLLISASNQAELDARVLDLLATPAAMRGVSLEPLLGEVSLGLLGTVPKTISPRYQLVANMLHWVIVGGESGRKARPMHPDWARSIRDQCQAAAVAFYFKQWGKHIPTGQHDWGQNGRLLDGKVWNQKPEKWR